MYSIQKNKIKFTHQFNEPITNSLIEVMRVNNITSIVFGIDFSYPIDNLPTGIKSIIFCSFYYDHPLDHLPYTLEELKLSKYFDRSIDNLPDSLRVIYFGEFFNKPIEYFPKQLKEIYFPITGHFNHKFTEIQDGLEILILPRNYKRRLPDMPISLKKLLVHSTYPYFEELKRNIKRKDMLNSYYL